MAVSGQIVIVGGTSGSGKSTTCEQFARRSREFWLLYGIDHFLAATLPPRYGHHGEQCREGIYAHPMDDSKPDGPLRWSFGPRGEQALHTFHEWIAAASRQGCNIVVDHLTMIDPPILQDAIWRMQGLPVLFVLLRPPFEVLERRIATRAMGGKSSSALTAERTQIIRDRLDRLRPWFYDAAYANMCCDLVIDTGQHAPEAACELIEDRLRAGPGVAFEELRRRFPRLG